MKEHGGYEDVSEDIGNDLVVRVSRRRGRPRRCGKGNGNVEGQGRKPGWSHYSEGDALGLAKFCIIDSGWHI